jgi:protoporphyrinogen oxidase
MRVLVVGGGLAGLSNALWLSRKGHEVVLVEKTPNLGGQLQTLSYKSSNNEEYLFDLGPHMVHGEDKIWNDLTRDVEKIITPCLRIGVKFGKYDLTIPIGAHNLISTEAVFLAKHLPHLLISRLLKRKETNLEDVLINQFGSSFYRTYVYNFISNFFKASPKAVSRDFEWRVRAPKIRNFLIPHTKKRRNGVNRSVYPKHGFGSSIKPLIQEIEKHNGQIKTNSTVQKITCSNNGVAIKIGNPKAEGNFNFDKVVWTGSLLDLVALLKIPHFAKLNYRDLLLVNCAVYKESLLEENVEFTYIMRPDATFHRVYEPKKICSTMAPKSSTSVCMEITLYEKNQENIPYLVKRSLDDLRNVFALSKNQIDYLGCSVLKNAYSFPFVGYASYLDGLLGFLQKNFQNIHLSGKMAHYAHWGITQTLLSARETSNHLLEEVS